MNRRFAVVSSLVLLLLLSGCFSFGGSSSNDRLLENASYEWEISEDVRIDLREDTYKAIYTIENRSTLRVYQRTRYGTEHPISIRGVQFRHRNGTVVNASAMQISEGRSGVQIDLPAENGTLAYTAPKRAKTFATPVLVEGTWRVIVPEDHRVDNIVLGTVRPGGYETELIDNRVHITWEELTSRTVQVDYYLARDVYLFAGLIAAVSIVGLIGIGYVYRQILALRKQREELGLNVEIDNQTDDGPPPGMR